MAPKSVKKSKSLTQKQLDFAEKSTKLAEMSQQEPTFRPRSIAPGEGTSANQDIGHLNMTLPTSDKEELKLFFKECMKEGMKYWQLIL